MCDVGLYVSRRVDCLPPVVASLHPLLRQPELVARCDAQLQKIYGKPDEGEKRYSPPECIGCETKVIEGNPEPRHISTSYVERNNLTMRMHMRRFTRLTNAFSKKVENHAHAVVLHFMYYNFCQLHKTHRLTPAVAAGVTERLWEVADIVGVLEEWESAQ